MKAIFWKEIRENLKWGALGFVLFSLGLAYGWSKTIDPYNNTRYLLILSPSIGMVVTLCSAIIGTALGFLQIVPEQRRDRWAFLVHRPVPWTTIFRGKAAAGLVLYFAATLLPWGFLCYMASLPGRVGVPFDWRMSLAGVAEILCGSVFYFAGMVTSLRQARWVGSKALALGGAVWAFLAVSEASHFWAACAWVAVMCATLAVAARGNFLRNGIVATQPAISKAALIVMFTLGAILLTAWVAGFAEGIFNPNGGYGTTMEYIINNEGEPVVLYSNGGTLREVKDVSGNPVPLSREELVRYTNMMPRLYPLQASRSERAGYSNYSAYAASAGEVGGTSWFYKRGKRRLEAYDHDSGELTGYMTPDGYHAASEGAPKSSFSEEYPTGMYMEDFITPELDGTRLYMVDLVELRIRQIAEVEKESDFFGAADIHPPGTLYNMASKIRIVVGLKGGIFFYNGADGAELFHVPYEQDIKKWDRIHVSATPENQHYVVWYTANFMGAMKAGGKLPEYIYRYSADGTLEKKWELPSLEVYYGHAPWTHHLWTAGIPLAGQIYDAGQLWIKKKMGDEAAEASWQYFYVIRWEDARWDWLVTIITGVLCAGAAFRKTRPYLLPAWEVAAWMVFVFFFGIAGLLVFLSVKEWPVRVACKACDEKRMVDREHCEHCNAPWEAPKRDGTEIFV